MGHVTEHLKGLLKSAPAVDRGAHRLMVEKLTIMSAMKRPTMPNTPPLAPTKARQVSSNAALKKLPAGHVQLITSHLLLTITHAEYQDPVLQTPTFAR